MSASEIISAEPEPPGMPGSRAMPGVSAWPGAVGSTALMGCWFD